MMKDWRVRAPAPTWPVEDDDLILNYHETLIFYMRRFSAKNLVSYLLRIYKFVISPMFLPACRYVPSCSEYAIEAVERYGAFQGSAMALWRVLRCHPFVKGGYDPVVKSRNAGRLSAEVCNH